MRELWLCLAFLWPSLAMAQAFPALYDVTGVASDDVLNIRNSANEAAEISGSLPPDTKGVEVLGLSPDGKWALVNGAQASGYVALRFLVAEGGDWLDLQKPIHCVGTEPFWGLSYDPVKKVALFSGADGSAKAQAVQTLWPGTPINNVAAIGLAGVEGQTMLVLKGAACSDGMSDTAFAITADLFLHAATGKSPVNYTGCCSISP